MPRCLMFMGRELKRVPLDFDAPLGEVWGGYQHSDMFDDIEPPSGEGYQCWETVSEGSPISPVFKTLDELCQWLANHPTGITDQLSASDWKDALSKNCGVIDLHTKEYFAPPDKEKQ